MEECDTYLTHISRHCWSGELSEKIKYIELSANTVTSISCSCLQLMKATVLAESCIYFTFSLSYLRSSDVYRHESARCHNLTLFLTFMIMIFKSIDEIKIFCI